MFSGFSSFEIQFEVHTLHNKETSIGSQQSAHPNIPSVATSPRNYFNQGCQMVYFQTKNPNLGNFWTALDWKMLVYFIAIWNILWTFGILYGHLVHFVFIWYIFPVLVSCTKKNLATLILTTELRH
jgi:hypothetical protein